jgi:DNA-binding CsgD family transcriptional regulator
MQLARASRCRRGRDNQPTQQHDISKLWQRSHEILRLAFLGYKHKEIALQLGISPITVTNTVNSSLGKDKLNLMRGAKDAETIDVALKVQELLPKAMQVYEDILTGNLADLKLKKQTADVIVKDLGGHAAPQRIEGKFGHIHAILTPEELNNVKERGRLAALKEGLLIEG